MEKVICDRCGREFSVKESDLDDKVGELLCKNCQKDAEDPDDDDEIDEEFIEDDEDF